MHQSKPLNRRAFVKRALCSASALVGLPHLIPSRAWGQSPGETPANDRITLGCIGLGWMGGQHLLGQFCGYPGTQVLALCDVDGNRLNRAKGLVENSYAARKKDGRYKGVDTYKDFRELLARPDIDAVVIATPEHWHALQAIAAAKAGKDIYCEKPLAYSIAEGKAIVEAVNRFGRVFQTGSQQRSDWRFRFACELVRNGYIGEVEEVGVNVAGTSGLGYVVGTSALAAI
jgi:predicted dehydrogenase